MNYKIQGYVHEHDIELKRPITSATRQARGLTKCVGLYFRSCGNRVGQGRARNPCPACSFLRYKQAKAPSKLSTHAFDSEHLFSSALCSLR